MLNKDNYVPCSSRLLCYVKIKPNGKLLVKSVLEGPYQYRMIEEPEAKQVEADDQAIQTILMGLQEDIYAAIDSCNQIGYNAGLNAWNQSGYNVLQNNANGNVVATQPEGNGNGNNANKIRCYNCRGEASTSCTHAYKAPIYDSNGSTEVHQYKNCYNNKIFNMFAQEEHYTDLLESTTGILLVQQDDNNVILVDSSMDPSRGIVEQHHATIEEKHAFYESLYNNLVIEVDKVNTVNRKTKEANVKLIVELARYWGREKSFKFNQAKIDEHENGYKNSVY
uniref:CCHC-type domain-containing protein n=1 Tax=Tanacetum cinerariifolium TaxID=118510 RepID=A0A699HHI5_TANCI|nr:hypothetical protein [Tanacetum cinerariifolium]